jgi:hypothetical protein
MNKQQAVLDVQFQRIADIHVNAGTGSPQFADLRCPMFSDVVVP